MGSAKHLIVSILLTLFLVSSGTAGYMIIEGWDILDALYMTVITMGTVGYDEVHEISMTACCLILLLKRLSKLEILL